MNIGEAIATLENGKRVAREGWHGDHFLILVNPDDPVYIDSKGDLYETQDPENEDHDQPLRTLRPFIGIIPVSDPEGITSWTCSQADLLANDWIISLEREGKLEDEPSMSPGDPREPAWMEARAIIHLSKVFPWKDIDVSAVIYPQPMPKGALKYEQTFTIPQAGLIHDDRLADAVKRLIRDVENNVMVEEMSRLIRYVDPAYSKSGIIHVARNVRGEDIQYRLWVWFKFE